MIGSTASPPVSQSLPPKHHMIAWEFSEPRNLQSVRSGNSSKATCKQAWSVVLWRCKGIMSQKLQVAVRRECLIVVKHWHLGLNRNCHLDIISYDHTQQSEFNVFNPSWWVFWYHEILSFHTLFSIFRPNNCGSCRFSTRPSISTIPGIYIDNIQRICIVLPCQLSENGPVSIGNSKPSRPSRRHDLMRGCGLRIHGIIPYSSALRMGAQQFESGSAKKQMAWSARLFPGQWIYFKSRHGCLCNQSTVDRLCSKTPNLHHTGSMSNSRDSHWECRRLCSSSDSCRFLYSRHNLCHHRWHCLHASPPSPRTNQFARILLQSRFR